MVAGLTFGNVVLCIRLEIQMHLQVKERAVERPALGAHGRTPDKAVEGGVGWSSFEAR